MLCLIKYVWIYEHFLGHHHIHDLPSFQDTIFLHFLSKDVQVQEVLFRTVLYANDLTENCGLL